MPCCISPASWVVEVDSLHHFHQLIHHTERQMASHTSSRKMRSEVSLKHVMSHVCLLVGLLVVLLVGLMKERYLDLLTLWHHLTLFMVLWESAKRRAVIFLSTSDNAWLWKQGLTMHAVRHTTEARGVLQVTEKQHACLDRQIR